MTRKSCYLFLYLSKGCVEVKIKNTMKEHEIQDQIRMALNFSNATMWRVNVLSGFSGYYQRHQNGDITISKPRFVSTGVPKGFPDLIGIKPIRITPEMVGKTVGAFFFIEVKSENGRLSQEQKLMHTLLKNQGALGGVARSVDDAIELYKKSVE